MTKIKFFSSIYMSRVETMINTFLEGNDYEFVNLILVNAEDNTFCLVYKENNQRQAYEKC